MSADIRPSPAKMRAGTTLRNIRVQEDLWKRAKQKAERENTSISEVLRRFLDQWVD
ncbi:ribbon-helix-helix protein, CopG family [Rhodococcus qingshengii]|uniref:ribbon-helix-helix protein, CopG family n=1 Tax=Rhodococcus qingshengii TaxID=334542 RepID=UPI0024B9B308|nr:ribbon-helix-helix protein, CopG family [Rhodococcus qingshengii]MDJ0490565.1 ribbon-helix-helix protein, CopG family [Rhodococcus qingshengii]